MIYCFAHHEITLPEANEFELTFFGPGYGESIVVHIPGIGWGVIDSCEIEVPHQRYVPPLEYLILQEVNRLAFLVLTHPHADHFRGMEKIVDSYIGRIDRVCRYSGDGVRELTVYQVDRGIKGRPGYAGLSSVFKAFQEAAEHGADKRHLGAMTQIIPRQDVSVNGRPLEVEVLSLSPLARDQESYADLLRSAIPAVAEQLQEIPDRKHNLIASALRISVGKVVVILGSDVEKGETTSSGWRGIVRSSDRPDLCVSALKVAHHGSPNAHYKQAWEEHCKRGKITSVIMPFNRGTKPRPLADDIDRIGRYSDDVGLTSPVRHLRPVDVYDRAVARRLPERWKIVAPSTECGMVTIRYDLEGNITLKKAVPPANWVISSG